MTVKIDSKIVSWEVEAQTTAPSEAVPAPVAEVVEMHEKIRRPDQLHGTTYKIKSPNSENALYIVVNDIILNEGTEHERRQPFEVFINSRDMSNYQWVSALTLVISAVFRKGGDVTFLIDELKQVFDPTGGYFKGGRFVPSLVAEIGAVIERHMISIGLLKEAGLDEHQAAFLDEKKKQLATAAADTGGYPASASLCSKCHTKAVVFADGCETCLSCGASKCS
ncbi:MAG: NrdJb [Congregibacter sp.]